jgi:hypothetical protein
MIEEQSLDLVGWAKFSDDRRMRYRLRRQIGANTSAWANRVVFVMCNPSLADAFKPDRTVAKCVKFARRWGGSVLEVVNLFALISPYPTDLLDHPRLLRGDDIENDREILEACTWPNARVIAAWGKWGALDGRAAYVRGLLRERHIKLEALRFTQEGFPTHPLARGKHHVPIDLEPQVWA